MPDKEYIEYLVICRGETQIGRHGLYQATFPIDNDIRLSDVDGSITVSLEGFQKIKLIQPGVVVVVNDLIYKEAGYRATLLRLATPLDVRKWQQTALSIEHKTETLKQQGVST